jgi:hypothetical protein
VEERERERERKEELHITLAGLETVGRNEDTAPHSLPAVRKKLNQ